VALPDWFLHLKLWMVEIASFISLGMWLYWALKREFEHLFRRSDPDVGAKQRGSNE
jgi:hypothetical protein